MSQEELTSSTLTELKNKYLSIEREKRKLELLEKEQPLQKIKDVKCTIL
jgi:hypothetical protein